MSDSQHSNNSNIPTWVPPGQHNRPKPGSPEAIAEQDRARMEEGRSSQSSDYGGSSQQEGFGGGVESNRGIFAPADQNFGGASPEDPRQQWAGSIGVDRSKPPPTDTKSPTAYGAQRSGAQGEPGNRKKTIIWVSVGVLGSLTLLYVIYLGFMWFLGWAAMKVPRSWEVQIGRSASQSILSENRVCGDRELNLFVKKMSTRLQGGVEDKPYEFRLKVLKQKQINAFALPGGYVFVFSGLLEKAESGEEVAGVLAHEMQHVLQRHSMKRIVRSLGLSIALRMIFGDIGGFVDFAAESAAKLGNLKYDRDQEHEADMEAVKQLYNAGVDPRGLPKFFERLAKKEKEMGSAEKTVMPFLSTHPPSVERRKRLMGYIKKRGLPQNMKPFTGFDEIKKRCGPITMSDPDADPPGLDKPFKKQPVGEGREGGADRGDGEGGAADRGDGEGGAADRADGEGGADRADGEGGADRAGEADGW